MTTFVYTVEPIDEFDGLTPLHHYLADGDPEHHTRWALKAVLALADADVGWNGDMRHLPLVGHLPSPPGTTPYLIIKQDNNGGTFIISEVPLTWLEEQHGATATEVTTRNIGGWNDFHHAHTTEPEF
jgi:hypothetical protein